MRPVHAVASVVRTMKTENPPSLATVLDLMLDAVCVVDATGRFVYVSAACEAIFGYTPQEMVGRQMIDMVAPEDRERTLQAATRVMSGQPSLHFENRYIRKDGAPVDIMWSARWSECDQLRVGVARDITRRKASESRQAAVYEISEAAHSTSDLAALFEQIHLIIGRLIPAPGFFVALDHGGIGQPEFPFYRCGAEPAAQALHAAAALCAEVTRTGQPLLLNPRNADGCGELNALARTDRFCWLAAPLATRQGRLGALLLNDSVQNATYRAQDRDLLQFVADQVATAIERKQLHARLERMAQHDELTGLPNRAVLFDRLKLGLARARRNETMLALLYLDLNGFKQINDHYGHSVGDLVLQAFARRLVENTRQVDTVARMGGDEFVVLLENSTLPAVQVVIENLHAAMRAPIELSGLRLLAQPSIGAACFPADGCDEASLLKRADEAMYQAKYSAAGRKAGASITPDEASG